MSIKYNAEGYYDPTAYTAILNVLKEDKRMSRAGEVWELESGRLVLVVADDVKGLVEQLKSLQTYKLFEGDDMMLVDVVEKVVSLYEY